MLTITLDNPELEGYFNNSPDEMVSALKHITKNQIIFKQNISRNLQELKEIFEFNKSHGATIPPNVDINELIDEINDVKL